MKPGTVPTILSVCRPEECLFVILVVLESTIKITMFCIELVNRIELWRWIWKEIECQWRVNVSSCNLRDDWIRQLIACMRTWAPFSLSFFHLLSFSLSLSVNLSLSVSLSLCLFLSLYSVSIYFQAKLVATRHTGCDLAPKSSSKQLTPPTVAVKACALDNCICLMEGVINAIFLLSYLH